ncbi:MAG: hypothetical protein NVSMB45_09220 [Ginsengibacter sp.]
MMTIAFTYKNQDYKALVDEKKSDSCKQFRITIMNGELETLLYGHNVILYKNNSFQENGLVSDDQANLLASLKAALIDLMEEPVVY